MARDTDLDPHVTIPPVGREHHPGNDDDPDDTDVWDDPDAERAADQRADRWLSLLLAVPPTTLTAAATTAAGPATH